MTNLCPVCQVPIRKNAKHCTLHAAEHGMQYGTAPRVQVKGICRLPGCTKPSRSHYLAFYCSDQHCRAHYYQIQKATRHEEIKAKQRQAAAKYRLSIGIKPRKAKA